jgi:hypothetical protein
MSETFDVFLVCAFALKMWHFVQAGPAQRNTCDLVMLLNTKFSSEEDFKKFSGFVIGLLK